MVWSKFFLTVTIAIYIVFSEPTMKNVAISELPSKIKERILVDSVINTYKIELPTIKKIVYCSKFINAQRKPQVIAIDENFNYVNLDSIRNAESICEKRLFGNLTKQLRNVLEKNNNDTLMYNVLLFLKHDPFEKKNRPTFSDLKNKNEKWLVEEKKINENRKSKFVYNSDLVAKKIIKLSSVNQNFTIKKYDMLNAISVCMSASDLKKIKSDEDIQQIWLLSGVNIGHDNNIASVVSKLKMNDQGGLHTFGFQGQGVNVCVWEEGYPNTVFANQLPTITMRKTFNESPYPNYEREHIAKMLGIIKNCRFEAGLGSGIAPQCNLLCANFYFPREDDYCNIFPSRCEGWWETTEPWATFWQDYAQVSVEALNWALTQNANVINKSWRTFGPGEIDNHTLVEGLSGDNSYLDMITDLAVLNYPYPTFCASAGNNADEFVHSKGYNAICVGWDNGNLIGNGDDIDPSSTFKNPNSGMELPHVTAPIGEGISVFDGINYPPGGSSSGTSASTASISGFAACLASQNSTLKMWPEAMRAIIMASSDNINNIPWDRYSIDDKSGIGRPNSVRASTIAANSNSTGEYGFNCFTADNDFNNNFNIQVSNTGTLRVVLSWTSDPLVGSEDFDLHVTTSTSHYYSASVPNTVEIVDVPITSPGTVNIEAYNYAALKHGPAFYAIAWCIL